MKRIICLVLAVLPFLAAAELYRWIDNNGRIQVGPVPPSNVKAERLDVGNNAAAPLLPSAVKPKVADPALKPPVIMYATSWCGYCRKARTYFKQNNIAYIEYDIEKDKAAFQRYKKLGGRGVPVITVADKTIFGFSPAKFEAVYLK